MPTLEEARAAVLDWGPNAHRPGDAKAFFEAVITLERKAKREPWAKDEQGYEIVVMSQETIDRLDEYSTSNPTGVFFGKRWKRQRRNSNGLVPGWLLCGYDFEPPLSPTEAVTHPRRIMTPEEYHTWAAAAPEREKPG